MTYTSAKLREKIAAYQSDADAGVEDWREIVSMLTAYAERLEQDEQTPSPADVSLYIRNAIDHGREEGRREVYREIAKLDPYDTAGDADCCNFCGYDMHQGQPDSHCDDGSTWTPNHEPDCLWIRATAALRETTPTP